MDAQSLLTSSSLSPGEISRALKVSLSTVYRWRAGMTQPENRQAAKLARILGATVHLDAKGRREFVRGTEPAIETRRAPGDLPALPARAADAHKGDCGRVLIVGGSRGMAGAPCLAARAAYRGGAGLVKVAVPESLWDVVAVKLDEALTAGLPETPRGALASSALEPLLELCAWAGVVVLGPGLSGAPETAELVRQAVPRINRPLILDADGLNAFAGPRVAELGAALRALPGRPVTLTPHPGEMARLLDTTTTAVQKDRRATARECARLTRSLVVLKGAGTLVVEGTRVFTNATGNPGLATGGTGDVLAGLLAALAAQGMEPYAAACLAVYLHGLAGDLAAQRLGPWSLMAGDLLDELPGAFLAHAKARQNREGRRG